MCACARARAFVPVTWWSRFGMHCHRGTGTCPRSSQQTQASLSRVPGNVNEMRSTQANPPSSKQVATRRKNDLSKKQKKISTYKFSAFAEHVGLTHQNKHLHRLDTAWALGRMQRRQDGKRGLWRWTGLDTFGVARGNNS